MAAQDFDKYAGEDFALPILRLWLFVPRDPWLYEHAKSGGSPVAKHQFITVLVDGTTRLCTATDTAESETHAYRRASHLYQQYPQQFGNAAAQHIKLSVRSAHCPPVGHAQTKEFITSSIFSVVCANHMCKEDSVKQMFPFLQTIPAVIELLHFLSSSSQFIHDKDFELVSEFSHCIVHIALAGQMPNAKAAMELAFQHSLMDRLLDLAPWFRWASKKPSVHLARVHLRLLLKNLGTWIFPHMVFLPVFRQIVRVVEEFPPRFELADMGDLSPIWEEVLQMASCSNPYKRAIPIDIPCAWAKVSYECDYGRQSSSSVFTVPE